MTFDEAVGRVIRESRRERGVSMRDLAAALDVTPSAVSRLETGTTQATVVHLRKIARELGVDGAVLVEKAERLLELFPERSAEPTE